jgi:hypothetical protein
MQISLKCYSYQRWDRFGLNFQKPKSILSLNHTQNRILYMIYMYRKTRLQFKIVKRFN